MNQPSISLHPRWLLKCLCLTIAATLAAEPAAAEPDDATHWIHLDANRMATANLSGAVAVRDHHPATPHIPLLIEWHGAGGVTLSGFFAGHPFNPARSEALVVELRFEGDEKTQLEVILAETDGRASFRGRIEVMPGDWTTVEIPLRWMRWSEGRVPRWPEIGSLELQTAGVGGGAGLSLRRIGVRNGTGALPDADEMTRLAFGTSQPQRIERAGLRVWNDSDQINADQLARQLEHVRKLILEEWGLPDAAQDGRLPTLLVFRDRSSYRNFVPRYATAVGASALRPDSGGFHLQGWALSHHDARHGSLRPVFTHEFSHSVIAHHALIDGSRSDWFHEGIAVRMQARFHPQDDLARIVRQGLRRAALPLHELCDGRSLELHHYWQAMTVVDWMVESGKVDLETRRQLVTAMQQSGSTDLGPHLQPVLKTDWPRLEADWRTWTRRHWAP